MRPGRLLHSTGGSADCYGGGWRKVAVPRRGARVTGVSLPVGPAELRVCLACVAAYGAVLGGRPPCRCLCPFLSFLYAWLAVVASLLAAPSHTNYPRQSGAHFACAVRWRALLPFFVCLFYPSSAAYPFLCLCTSQGAITMAVFGSGMRNEYAFFGYEGDFVRCHFGRSDCVCRPRSWLAAGSTVWARRGAATNGEESAVVRGDDAERCSDATPGPRSAFGAGPELPPPGCVSVALSLAPPPPPAPCRQKQHPCASARPSRLACCPPCRRSRLSPPRCGTRGWPCRRRPRRWRPSTPLGGGVGGEHRGTGPSKCDGRCEGEGLPAPLGGVARARRAVLGERGGVDMGSGGRPASLARRWGVGALFLFCGRGCLLAVLAVGGGRMASRPAVVWLPSGVQRVAVVPPAVCGHGVAIPRLYRALRPAPRPPTVGARGVACSASHRGPRFLSIATHAPRSPHARRRSRHRSPPSHLPPPPLAPRQKKKTTWTCRPPTPPPLTRPSSLPPPPPPPARAPRVPRGPPAPSRPR